MRRTQWMNGEMLRRLSIPPAFFSYGFIYGCIKGLGAWLQVPVGVVHAWVEQIVTL